jgi:glycosyltransferase involved in cell wall biosynthesis
MAKILLAIPCFNPTAQEWAALALYLNDLKSNLKLPHQLEVIFVDDGSPRWIEPSAELLNLARVIRLGSNQGKGAALKRAVNELDDSFDVFAFTDHDLPFSVEDLLGVIGAVLSGCEVAIGDRELYARQAVRVSGRWSRGLGHRLFRLFVRAIVAGGVADSQCGLKAYDAKVVRCVVEKSQINGFLFDLEWLYIALRHKCAVRSWPVRVDGSHESSSLRSFVNGQFIKSLVNLVLNIALRFYDNEDLLLYMESKRVQMRMGK